MQIWDKEVVNGQIKRLQDEDIQSNVLEIVGPNMNTTYITCPVDPAATLENKLPHQLGYDRPSSKLMNFLVKHYQLSGYILQTLG